MHNKGMRYLLVLVSAVWLCGAAQFDLTIAKLREFLESSVKMKESDVQVAQFLKQVKLTEKLDDATVEDLQKKGLGPKTVAALRAMVDSTASLPVAPPVAKVQYVPPPDPSLDEQHSVLDEVREYVANYSKSLPNFICVQVTRRYVDMSGKATAWHPTDTITSKLTYDGVREDYQVILKNSQPVTNVKMEELDGTVSEGEFGTMMKEIFDAQSQATFGWDHWATLRTRRTYVFSYDIAQANSRYRVEEKDTKQSIEPAYRGQIFVDRDTKMVTKITLNPYGIAPDFPIQDLHMTLDYDFAKIADGTYMLPLKAVLTSREGRAASKNEIEFRLYNKFETGSTIKFDTPDALPDDQTKEKPPEGGKVKNQ
jgi:hypothetical protein